MGITGLLPVLKSIAKQQHVGAYRGQRVAIDGFSWLHKGAYCCARELCEGTYTDKFVRYCMSRVDMLLQSGVQPVLIFDGGRLPMKADEEDTRRRFRNENKAKALAHLAAGNVAAAEECFQRAASVTSAMAKQFIEALKERGVSYIVAPYEADAQMAYLALQGHVHAIITEDSDLLAYGCPRVLYKLDKHGYGEEILLDNLVANQTVSFVGFTHDMFVMMCIMAGCDFLPSLPNIGLKKAHTAIKKHRNFVKVIKALRFSGVNVPRDYEQRFQRTMWVFRHQRVYCPAAGALVHVQPLPPGGLGAANVDVMSAIPEGEEASTLDFLGPPLDPAVAQGIALGDLNPNTKLPYDLAAIYAGCRHLPRGVARALGADTQGMQPASGAASCRSEPQSRSGFGWSQGLPAQSAPTSRSQPSSGHTDSQPEAAPHLLVLGATGQPILPGLRRPQHSVASLSKKAASTQAAGAGIRRYLSVGSGTSRPAASAANSQQPTTGSEQGQPPASTGSLSSFVRQRGGLTGREVQPGSASKRKFPGGANPPGTRAKAPDPSRQALMSWLGSDHSKTPEHVHGGRAELPAALEMAGVQQSGTPDRAGAAGGQLSDVTNTVTQRGAAGAAVGEKADQEQGARTVSGGAAADMEFDQFPVSPCSSSPQPRSASKAALMHARPAPRLDRMPVSAPASPAGRLQRLPPPGVLDYMGSLEASAAHQVDLLLGMEVGPGTDAGARAGLHDLVRPRSAMAALSSGAASLSQGWLSGPGLAGAAAQPSDLDLCKLSDPSASGEGLSQHEGKSAVSLGLADDVPAAMDVVPCSHGKLDILMATQEHESPALQLLERSFGGPSGAAGNHQGPQTAARRKSAVPRISSFFPKQDAGWMDCNLASAAAGNSQSLCKKQQVSASELLQRTVQRMQASLMPRMPQASPPGSAMVVDMAHEGATFGRLPARSPVQPFAMFAAPGHVGKFGLRPRRASEPAPAPLPAEASSGQERAGVLQADAEDDTGDCVLTGTRDPPEAACNLSPEDCVTEGRAAACDFHDIGHVTRFQAVAAKALKQVESDLAQRFAFSSEGRQQEETPFGGSAGQGQQPQAVRGQAKSRWGGAGLGTKGSAHEAKKPFKPPRMAKGAASQAANASDAMGIKRFAFVMPR